MKTSKLGRKLTLKKETIARLNQTEMLSVNGGSWEDLRTLRSCDGISCIASCIPTYNMA